MTWIYMFYSKVQTYHPMVPASRNSAKRCSLRNLFMFICCLDCWLVPIIQLRATFLLQKEKRFQFVISKQSNLSFAHQVQNNQEVELELITLNEESNLTLLSQQNHLSKSSLVRYHIRTCSLNPQWGQILSYCQFAYINVYWISAQTILLYWLFVSRNSRHRKAVLTCPVQP